jgi:hypothetical protein
MLWYDVELYHVPTLWCSSWTLYEQQHFYYGVMTSLLVLYVLPMMSYKKHSLYAVVIFVEQSDAGVQWPYCDDEFELWMLSVALILSTYA